MDASSEEEPVMAPANDFECRDCENEVEKVKIVRDPGTPTAAERAAHDVTHLPYRPWCEHCVRGRATGQQHRTVKGDLAESTVTRVGMDYGFIQEDQTIIESEHGTETKATLSMTILVMVETLCHSIWSYAVEGKGIISTDWLAPKLVEDMTTIGLSKERIIAKSDQEPAIVQLQKEIVRLRQDAGTALENSRVGDSDSNGRVENAIRDVKAMIRTLRSHVEVKAETKIRLDAPIVPWMVRHAGYLITRCRVREDGKTAMQKMKGRRINTPLLPFAEIVLFKLPKVSHMPGDFQDKFEAGVWLGCTVRSGEHLVATANGVYKVSSVIRGPEDRRWSSELLEKIRGTPREPVPGSGSTRPTAFAKRREDADEKPPEFRPRRTWDDEPEVRVSYIYKKDVEKFGQTEGCPGCRALMTPGSRFRAKHTPECRARFEEELMRTEEGLKRVERAGERMTHALVAKSEEVMAKTDKGTTETFEHGTDENDMEVQAKPAKGTTEAPEHGKDMDGAEMTAAAGGSGMTDDQRRRSVEDQNSRELRKALVASKESEETKTLEKTQKKSKKDKKGKKSREGERNSSSELKGRPPQEGESNARGAKRAMGDGPNDPRKDMGQGAEVVAMPMPETPGLPGPRSSAVPGSPMPDRGSKRRAEDEGDDPRVMSRESAEVVRAPIDSADEEASHRHG